MSTWGGIGEGLTEGLNRRIALEEQRRKDRQAQANADRDFAFKREQADVAQANADREFEAKRSDADRTFNEGVRRADMAQANADREFGLKQDEAALKTDIAAIEADQRDRELALKERSQSWEDQISSEKVRSFRLANEKLDREERQAKMADDTKRESGRQQLAMAIHRVTGAGGQEQTITLNENGQQVQKKVRVLPQSSREQIFGKDGYFKDVQNVIAFEDEKGNTIAALVKPDGTMQMFSPEQQYSIYESGFGKAFADEQMRGEADKRDLGMFAAKEGIKANATLASDREGIRSLNSLFQTGIKEGIFTDEESREIADYALGVMRKRKGTASGGGNAGGEWTGFSAEKRAYLENNGYVWDSVTGKPVKRQKSPKAMPRITAPTK